MVSCQKSQEYYEGLYVVGADQLSPVANLTIDDLPAVIGIKVASSCAIGDHVEVGMKATPELVESFNKEYKKNYELLPEHEKANIRRNLGDLLYVGAAIIGAIAITGMGGDDDESIMYNLMLYHADRLASEAASFTPFGAYAEGKKLWSSPVAIGQTINDLLGTTAMAARFLIEEDFTEEYTTGRYKGMNKFEVMAVRNIPVIRSINRVLDLPNNNSYYKLNENILSIIPYKDIAKDIFE